ncbi:MAG: hypothetical protein Kow0025_00810 [Thermodesulfovibrionales bacterium]
MELVHSHYVVDYISVGILLTAVSLSALRRLESCVRAYRMNSWLLALLMAVAASTAGEPHLYFAALVTFLSKGVVIPLFLFRLIRQMKATREVEPYISGVASFTVSAVLVAVVYASLREGIFISGFPRHAFQVSLAIILVGLFIMITRKKAVSQVIGLLFMENGLFLAGFSLTRGMPTVMELGVLFDMLMGVIILGIFAVQIRRALGSADLDKLTVLKG